MHNRDSQFARQSLWLRRTSRLLLALSLVSWAAWAALSLTYWSDFTAGRIREHPPEYGRNPLPLPGKTNIEERDELHYMAGKGAIFISGNTVRSGSFSQPHSEAASKSLAWIRFDDQFPRWYIWRYYVAGPNQVIGIRFFPLSILLSLAWFASIVIRRMQILPGFCLHCRYDLRGIGKTPPTSKICPECGARTM